MSDKENFAEQDEGAVGGIPIDLTINCCTENMSCANPERPSTSHHNYLPINSQDDSFNILQMLAITIPGFTLSYLMELEKGLQLSEEEDLCTNCRGRPSVTFRCLTCSVTLCEHDAQEHRGRCHRVVQQESNSLLRRNDTVMCEASSSQSVDQTTRDNSAPRSTPTSPTFCATHFLPLSGHCESCHFLICCECFKQCHSNHCVTNLTDAHKNCRKLHTKVNNKIAACGSKLNELLASRRNFDIRTAHLGAKIRNFIKTILAALEKRERELLCQIDDLRNKKAKMLDTHEKTLNTLIKLSQWLQDTLKSESFFEQLTANSSAVEKLRRLCDYDMHLEISEMDFETPDLNVREQIRTMGKVLVVPLRRPPRLFHGGLQPAAPYYGRAILNSVNSVIAKLHVSTPTLTFSSQGGNDGCLCRPWGVCCNSLGHIYVADRSNHRIQVFNKNGEFMFKFGSGGSNLGKFDKPTGITIDGYNRVIVADKDNHRVQVFQMDGTFLFTFGRRGSEDGQFIYPFDVATNSQCQIVVSDSYNNRIQMFNPDGGYIKKFSNPQQDSADANKKKPAKLNKNMPGIIFDLPRGVCFTPKGNILVTDFNLHRVSVINPATNKTQFCGNEGNALRQFQRPQGIICDDSGNILIVDTKNDRIQALDSDGNYLKSISTKNIMKKPTSLCLSPEGEIIVVDFGNNKIHVY